MGILFWLAVLALIAAIAIVVILLVRAGQSQPAVELARMRQRLIEARAREDFEEACRIARQILEFLDRKGLRGGDFDVARQEAQAVLQECEEREKHD